jgi:hypothetical protein
MQLAIAILIAAPAVTAAPVPIKVGSAVDNVRIVATMRLPVNRKRSKIEENCSQL